MLIHINSEKTIRNHTGPLAPRSTFDLPSEGLKLSLPVIYTLYVFFIRKRTYFFNSIAN